MQTFFLASLSKFTLKGNIPGMSLENRIFE